jgi:hypothetical protein
MPFFWSGGINVLWHWASVNCDGRAIESVSVGALRTGITDLGRAADKLIEMTFPPSMLCLEKGKTQLSTSVNKPVRNFAMNFRCGHRSPAKKESLG